MFSMSLEHQDLPGELCNASAWCDRLVAGGRGIFIWQPALVNPYRLAQTTSKGMRFIPVPWDAAQKLIGRSPVRLFDGYDKKGNVCGVFWGRVIPERPCAVDSSGNAPFMTRPEREKRTLQETDCKVTGVEIGSFVPLRGTGVSCIWTKWAAE